MTTARATVSLVERRTRVVRLPPEDAAYLSAYFRHVIDLTPDFRPHRYRLTPRGYVGWIDGPNRRFAIEPKLPWSSVLILLGLESRHHLGLSTTPGGTEILRLLARLFANQLTEITRNGLIRGYQDTDTEAAFLRGRLRTAEQLRDAAGTGVP